MMVAVMPADLLTGILLRVLLKVREVLLRRLQVSRLQGPAPIG